MRLRPSEWRSGDILWLIEAVDDPRIVPQFLKQLSETKFKGREVKVRSRAQDGTASVAKLGSALSGATPPA
jgi:hemolysin-activating ACP:hemolysin acyltransferase